MSRQEDAGVVDSGKRKRGGELVPLSVPRGESKTKNRTYIGCFMPRLTFNFEGDAFADGAGGDKFLCDVSEKLSKHYGKLVRQSNVFKVRSVHARLYNPNTLVQDEVMSVSGALVYYEPTKNRKLAWQSAFQAWLNNRKALGIKSRGADFRVGLTDGYKTDVGALGPDGVKYNAWINADDDTLQLHSGTVKRSIFATYNDNMESGSALPNNPNGGFGHWAQKDADALLDELDFVQNESPYYNEGEACVDAQFIPFMLNFASWFDNGSAIGADAPLVTEPQAVLSIGNASNSEQLMGPFNVMCGLMGVYVDTTTVDDSEFQTQDWGLQVIIDVESWSPIMRPRRRGRKQLKGGKK